MKHNKSLIIGLSLFITLLLVFFVGPYLPFVDQKLTEHPPLYENGVITDVPFPPSEKFPLGTDDRGRDAVSLLILGGRETYIHIFLVVTLSFFIAIPISSLAIVGKRNPLNWLLNIIHASLSYLPTLLIMIIFVKLPFIFAYNDMAFWFLFTLTIIEANRVSVIFRDQIMELSHQEYIYSGIAVGNSPWGLFRKYYLPNLLPSILVQYVLNLSKIMLLLGQMGFLRMYYSKVRVFDEMIGFSIVNKSVSWPSILSEARFFITDLSSLHIWLGLAITISIVTFHLLREGLQKHYERNSVRYIGN